MIDTGSNTGQQLKDTCKLTNAVWAIWIERVGLEWVSRHHSGMGKTRQNALLAMVTEARVSTHIAGSLSTGRVRTRKTNQLETALGCKFIYIFPNTAQHAVLLVGADQLDRNSQKFFRILSQSAWPQPHGKLPVDQVLADILVDLDLDASYDLQSVLMRVLQMLVRYIPCEAAGIGLCYGDTIHLEVSWPDPLQGSGQQAPINLSTLDEIMSKRSAIIVDGKNKGKLCPLMPDVISKNGSWLGVPILVGKRVIGIICFLSSKPGAYTQDSARQAAVVASHMAPAIETSMALAEASKHLEKLALLNELASAASIGADAGQVASSIVQRLKRIFNTELVSILWLSPDGKTLHEFGDSYPSLTPLVIAVDESLAGYVAETGLPVRVGDVKEAPRYLKITDGVVSELSVPLKYHGNVIGVLDLESKEPEAFSLRDEQLLVVMASQLAGLIENVRLNDETRRRAQNLELIHQMVQAIIGLVDINQIAQVAAELMAERFGFELVLINLVDENSEYLVVKGVGGAVSPGIVKGLKKPIETGVVGQVCKDGNSRLVNDVNLEPDYVSLPGWQGGSEMCVALRDGGIVFGVVNVERSTKDGFTENDLLALEALAGVLSSVMISARSYQQIQMHFRHLQAVRETALDVGSDLDLNTLLERVTLRARELVGAKGAELGLVNEEQQVVEIRVSKNPWPAYSKGLVLPFNQGIAGHMAVDGKTLVVDDYVTWSGRLKLGNPPPFTAVAGVPLKYKGKVIGTLTISHDEPSQGFDPEDIRLLELLAPQVAVSIRNARLYQELQALMEAERKAKDHLIRSARLAAVGELAAGVAHELNNPLTTVAGFVELVLDDLPEESPHRVDLELVLKEAHRAREVVRRLLDFSRPGEGFRVRADVNDLVSDVVALIRHLVHTNGIELHIELSEAIPWIQVDRDQIKQVFLNLVHNAIQAMPRGGTLLLRTALQTREDTDGVMIQVEDSGLGIAPENLDRLFEPFFTTRAPGKGTGLGLSVSYGIIMDHDGVIDVQSELGEGSIFTVWLPLESKKVLL